MCVEGSSTLLNNVIAMTDELSGIYAVDEGQDKVSSAILEKMFNVISDRCSVNKLFNKQFDIFLDKLCNGSKCTQYLTLTKCGILMTLTGHVKN